MEKILGRLINVFITLSQPVQLVIPDKVCLVSLDVTEIKLERRQLDPLPNDLKIVTEWLVHAERPVSTTLGEYKVTVESNGNRSFSKAMMTY